MFDDVDWPLKASCGFVSISWASCSSYCAFRFVFLGYFFVLFFFPCFFSPGYFVFVSTNADDWLERVVSKMIDNVLMGMLNPTYTFLQQHRHCYSSILNYKEVTLSSGNNSFLKNPFRPKFGWKLNLIPKPKSPVSYNNRNYIMQMFVSLSYNALQNLSAFAFQRHIIC